MADKFWDSEVTIGEVKASDKGKYIVTKTEKSGKKYICVRNWYCTQNDPTWKPGKGGINLPADQAAEILNMMLKEVNAVESR